MTKLTDSYEVTFAHETLDDVDVTVEPGDEETVSDEAKERYTERTLAIEAAIDILYEAPAFDEISYTIKQRMAVSNVKQLA